MKCSSKIGTEDKKYTIKAKKVEKGGINQLEKHPI
jgi:hypothetical protein